MRKTKHYGYLRDLPDYRDQHYNYVHIAQPLPVKFDFRDACPPVYNQGALGSCTANAIAGAYEYLLKKEGKPQFSPSRLFIYYNERGFLRTEDSDSGAMIRDGIKTLNKDGTCSEEDWPYVIGNFTYKPNTKCYETALDHQVLSYERATQSLLLLKSALIQSFPIVFGITVYENFESRETATSGIVSMPHGHMLGGHAIMMVGYDDVRGMFLCRNSWGEAWGDGGYFWIPYQYVGHTDLAADFWVLKIVE